jgi:hypothetical protein
MKKIACLYFLGILLLFCIGSDSCGGGGGDDCCKHCDNSCACGDSCIPCNETCHKGDGCACD